MGDKFFPGSGLMTEKNRYQQIAQIVRKAVSECLAEARPALHEGLTPTEIFQTPEAEAAKREIIEAGRKLWHRQYVDGNGGNISYRLTPRYVICTPTLCSKGDLTEDDLSLVDLDNCQLCGERPQTSEILLHLEIYKAVPRARGVIHCHPPYATAHAIAGVTPPSNLIPEQEIFIGKVAVSPYETPGTVAFAQTVLPYVEAHNTILLQNHGIVCWADSVTHAEWFVEVVETFCKTSMIARQLSPTLPEIPPEKILDLLERKKGMGLPDPRLPRAEGSRFEDLVRSHVGSANGHGNGYQPWEPAQVDALVDALTMQVMEFLESVHATRG
jgi:L-fuculose-phosphate aldolase